MLKIHRHSIQITRGDSVRFTIALKNRELPEGTKAVFTVRDTPWDPCMPAIEKEIDVLDGNASVILETADTEIAPGNYVWDVRVKEPNENGEDVKLTPMEYAAFVVVEAIGV